MHEPLRVVQEVVQSFGAVISCGTSELIFREVIWNAKLPKGSFTEGDRARVRRCVSGHAAQQV